MKSVYAVDVLSLSTLQELDISADNMLNVYDLIACAVRLDDMGKSEVAWNLLYAVCNSFEDFAADSQVSVRSLLGTVFEYLNHGDEPIHAFGAF